MSFKYITQVIMVLGIAVWIGWDLIVATNKTSGDTISEITLVLSQLTPVLPFAVGFLCGHLFGAGDWRLPLIDFVKGHPFVPFLLGVPAGMLFWAQTR
jgi:hypothetical protein